MAHYKIKLASQRILGPLDLALIKQLIAKKKIVGNEQVRMLPNGQWMDINQVPEIALALVNALVEKTTSLSPAVSTHPPSHPLSPLSSSSSTSSSVSASASFLHSPANTKLAVPTQNDLELLALSSDQSKKLDGTQHIDQALKAPPILPGKPPGMPPASSQEKNLVGEPEATLVIQRNPITAALNQNENASSDGSKDGSKNDKTLFIKTSQLELVQEFIEPQNVSQENTIVFQRNSIQKSLKLEKNKKIRSPLQILKIFLASLILGNLGYRFVFVNSGTEDTQIIPIIRPKLPEYQTGSSNSSKSQTLYLQAMKFYVLDTVTGYMQAAEKLREACSYDITNVKALAMLASSYINLIDSSNKDENYFFVISKLIDMSRAKAVDLPETVIANLEFYIITNKIEAAQNEVVNYTKTHENFGLEMFYYLSLVFFEKRDFENAAHYLSQFPDDKVFSAKVFYLRAQVSENLGDFDAAQSDYERALKFYTGHSKSHLKLAYLLSKKGNLKGSVSHLEFIMKHSQSLSPKDLAAAAYLYALYFEGEKKLDLALRYIERATVLDPENHDYLLENYTLQSQILTQSNQKLSDALIREGRMYANLTVGERLVRQGKYEDALIPFLSAREVNGASPLPLVKIGDMFNYIGNISDARANYKLAAERSPNDIKIWSKYINILIQSFEWDEAKKAMDRFRKLPVPQSSIDKAAADMYQKQGKYLEAQVFYRKAMARETIDPDVYISYAKSLMSINNFKDAPFFFSLALRFDPFNVEAINSIAHCIAETESVDRGINFLQDHIKKSKVVRAEFLAAVAELQIQKGDYKQAQLELNQAIEVNPHYAYSWKVQAKVYLNDDSKKALDNALLAFRSFSDRNPSDPSGYLERYKIFTKRAEFEKAKEELNRIYEIFPKYPNLHYYLGALYGIQGNHKAASEEFRLELENNAESVQTLLVYGRELLELGQFTLALTQFSKAMNIDPKSAEAKQNAGWANYYLHNYLASTTLIRAAISLDPANPLYYKRLGIVFRDSSDMVSACAAFRKYLEMEPDAIDKEEFQNCLGD